MKPDVSACPASEVLKRWLCLAVFLVLASCSRTVPCDTLATDNVVFVKPSFAPGTLIRFDKGGGKLFNLSQDWNHPTFEWQGHTFRKNVPLVATGATRETASSDLVLRGKRLFYQARPIAVNVYSLDFAIRTPAYLYWGGVVQAPGEFYNFYCINRFSLDGTHNETVRVGAKETHFEWNVFPLDEKQ